MRPHGRHVILEQFGGSHTQRLRRLQDGQQGCVLQAAFDRTDMSPVNAHTLSHCLLAETRR